MSEQSSENQSTGTEQILSKDSFNGSLGIVIGTIVLATIIIVLFWRNFIRSEKKEKASGGFVPPVERQKYIEAKEKLGNSKDPLLNDQLRKLLVKRALKAVPHIFALQNEGQSIDRLYNKGMLTDDMHFHIKELKAFMDHEIPDVKREADELMEGWGEHVWQQAVQTHMTVQRQLETMQQQQQANSSSADTTAAKKSDVVVPAAKAAAKEATVDNATESTPEPTANKKQGSGKKGRK